MDETEKLDNVALRASFARQGVVVRLADALFVCADCVVVD
jgi:hypothetical protein